MPTPPTPDPAAEPAATGGTADPTAASTAESSPSVEDAVEDDGKGGNAEAARYRRQLRETQGERDALAGRVERLQHADVSRIVSDRLAVPADLFAFGLTLADVLGDDGEVDPGLVETAVCGLLASRPGLAKGMVPARAPASFGQGTRTSVAASSRSWANVLRGE